MYEYVPADTFTVMVWLYLVQYDAVGRELKVLIYYELSPLKRIMPSSAEGYTKGI